MLNKFTLSFKSAAIEEEFREEQQKQVKEEYNLFTIQCLKFFFPFYVMSYFSKEYFNVASVLIILIIAGLIVIFKLIIDNYPRSIALILPILQILFALVWSIDDLLYNSKYDQNQYRWFYGFQAYYFHHGMFQCYLAIMLQGYQILPQVFTILLIYFWFLIDYGVDSLEFVMLSITWFSVLIGLFFLKYTSLRLKRLQFIDNRERNKWIKIIEQIVDYHLIVVEFDKKQDQIVMRQINEQTKEKFKIQDNQDFRKLLRDMQIINSSSTSKTFKISLEMAIREQFCHNFQQLVPSYDVTSNILKQDLRVKLIQYFFQEIQCVILVFDSESRKDVKQAYTNQKLKEGLFLQITQNLLNVIQIGKSKVQILQQIVNLQFYRMWINKNCVIQHKSNFSTKNLTNMIQKALDRKICLIESFEKTDQIYLDFKFLLMAIVGLTQLFDERFKVKFKVQKQSLFTTLTIKITAKKLIIPINIFNLIGRILDFNEEDWIICQERIIDCMKILTERWKSVKTIYLFSFLMCKYILFSSLNQSTLKYKERKDTYKQISFDIVIQ